MIAPPRTTVLLLEALGASAEFREPLLGDLAEEFAQRAERDGVPSARRWYYREAVRATPHLLRAGLRGLVPRDVTRVIGILMTSYTLVLVIGLLVSGSVNSILIANGTSIRNVMLLHGVQILTPFGFVEAIAGGYFAASLDKKAPLVSAITLAIVWSTVSAATSVLNPSLPLWHRIGLPILMLIGTTTGGILRVRRPHPRQIA